MLLDLGLLDLSCLRDVTFLLSFYLFYFLLFIFIYFIYYFILFLLIVLLSFGTKCQNFEFQI